MKILISLLLTSALIYSSFAQEAEPIVISEELKSMSKGEQPCIVVEIPEADFDFTIKEMEKVAKQKSKVKAAKENDETFIENAVWERVSSEPFNVYFVIKEFKDHVRMSSWFERDGNFISSTTDEDQFLSIEKILYDFAVLVYTHSVEEDLEDEEKVLKGLDKELDGLQGDNEKLNQDVADNTREIEGHFSDIEVMKNDLEQLNAQISAVKGDIQTLSSGDTKDAAEKELKDLEKDRDKMEKSIDKAYGKIDDAESKIRDLERDIEDNLKDQEKKKEEIEAQEQKIADINTKLNSIK